MIVSGVITAPRYRGFVAFGLMVLDVVVVTSVLVLTLIGRIGDRPILEVALEFAGNIVAGSVCVYFVVKTLGWGSSAPVSALWRS
jgi:hypothetical protein